ncbi:MAG: glycosyltransferase family 2 protein [Tidjanibacter sp.]|nr:glycosyltransferase family 2 protein [Tidjanibacter sp.]
MQTTKVVILNWNGASLLERFLPRVVTSVPEWARVVVADNGSTDNSEEVVARMDGVEWLPLGENYGFAGGYNRALRDMEGDYFVLLNSDVEPAEGWLEPLVARLESNPRLAAVQPKIRAYNAPEMFEYAGAAGGYIDLYGYPFCRGRIMGTVERDEGQYDSSRSLFWASGACMVVRAEAWRKAGGLDEDFFAHMEEIDLCWRLQLMGYEVEAVGDSVVYHIGGGTLPNNSPRKIYLNFRNSLAMMYKCLPEKEMWRLKRRLWMDRLSQLVYLLKGEWSYARAVGQAHRDYRAQSEELERKRRRVWQGVEPSQEPTTIYRRWIVWQYFMGRKHLSQLTDGSAWGDE